jgi:hypothetical protein
MSAQTDILNAIESRVNVVLPSYKRLKYSYDVEKNNKRASDDAYGIGAGAGSSVEGTFRTITMDQEFFVILTKDFGGRSDDNAERTALKAIYDDMETLYRDLFQSKLGIPSVVYLVSELSLDEPEKIADNVISVRMGFTVKHRKST